MKPAYLAGYLKRDIMRWIERNTPGKGIDLSKWQCGITSREEFKELEKYIEQKKIDDLCFRSWDACNVNISREVETYFTKNGINNKPARGGPKDDQTFVFIFKTRPNAVDEILKCIV